jgi:two-component system, OmpR family, response regulator
MRTTNAPDSPLVVLVVDDDEDTVRSTAQLLELYTVTVATSGDDALVAATAIPPDVILLDLSMPDTDGYEVARWLRVPASGKRPFIIAVSGWGREEDRSRSAQAGIDLHMVKPVAPAELLRVLGRFGEVLGRSQPALSAADRQPDLTPAVAGSDGRAREAVGACARPTAAPPAAG